jgi:uncharacterized protein
MEPLKIKSRIDLTEFETMYDSFDPGHDRRHMEEVRNCAVELAQIYCPDMVEIAYVAATLHDIGLSISRDGHEKHGVEILNKNEKLKEAYTKEEVDLILEAVGEHRASTGKPRSIVAKIVSDSDKTGFTTSRVLQRAYDWGCEAFPTVNHDGQLLRAAYHLKLKFGGEGTGTRVYFKESKERLNKVFEPIFNALGNDDLDTLNQILEKK